MLAPAHLPPADGAGIAMTLAEAHAIIAANDVAGNGSFLFWLHERQRFDRAAFWELCNAGIIAGSAEAENREQLRERAFHIYDGILRLLLWHHSHHDQCRIRHVPGRNLNEYVDRLAWALEPLIRGRPGFRWDAPLALKNPDQTVLERYLQATG